MPSHDEAGSPTASDDVAGSGQDGGQVWQGEPKWVYAFAAGYVDGRANMTELLGGKGANLAEMASLGLPVPPGFTITTKVCDAYYAHGRKLPEGLKPQVEKAMRLVGDEVGATFGDVNRPLLVSVRSGARASMPGMMDTILNLGLNDETVEGLAKRSGDRRFAYDSYRRFIQMYADVVLGVDHGVFEDLLENFKNLNALASDTELRPTTGRRSSRNTSRRSRTPSARPFPQDTNEQLYGAIAAVFGSWQNARANTYRRLHDIPDSWGTAVTVQAMVFGNLGESSATGVAFTRNPSTGAKEIYGEFLLNAQGEDVVAGIRTPQPLTERGAARGGRRNPFARSADAQAVRRLGGGLRAAREALPRHAGHRVHHRERQAVDAADALGQAHGGSVVAHRRRSRRGWRDLQARSGDARQRRRRSTSCCIRRSIPMRRRTC